ncbi:MAG: hypothetical protein WDN24_05540 [Sphingomonas sp.]
MPNCFAGDDFVVLDVTAYWRILPALTLRAGRVQSHRPQILVVERYPRACRELCRQDAYSQPGRNGSVSLSYRF